jgi:hypothetical protein
MRSKRIALLLTGAVATIAAAGCGDDDNDKTSTTSSTKSMTTEVVDAPGASVRFASPKDGSTQNGTVSARVSVSNFKLAAASVGQKAKQGEGHLHFSMDGGKYDQPKYSGANGKLAVKLGVQGKYSPAVTPTITYKKLPPGEHELEVYLANNDHSDTGVEAKTSFTVK